LGLATAAPPPVQGPGEAQKGAVMTSHAKGTFEVKATPLPAAGQGDAAASIGRASLEKQFHGDLEATSAAEMLSWGTGVGSGAYVAIERVSGTLQGRTGTFVMQHSGTMERGVPRLSVTVVPDSGTGQLAGLAGTMDIQIAAGKHSYDFAYTLPAAP
jgi:hypothetical protein